MVTTSDQPTFTFPRSQVEIKIEGNVLSDNIAAQICQSLPQAKTNLKVEDIPTVSSSCRSNLPVRKRKSAGTSLGLSNGYVANPPEAKRINMTCMDDTNKINNVNNFNTDPLIGNTYTNAGVISLQNLNENPVTDLPPINRPPMPKAREIRLEQNRKAARESRRRKKVMIEELQRSVIFFSRANATLKQQNDELQGILFRSQAAIQKMNSSEGEAPTAGESAEAAKPPASFESESNQASNTNEVTNVPSQPPQPQLKADNTEDSACKQTTATPSEQKANVIQNPSTPAMSLTSNDTAAAAVLLSAASSNGTSPATASHAFMPFLQAMAITPSAMIPNSAASQAYVQQQLAAAHFFAAAANPVVFQQQQVAIQQLHQQAAAAWQNVAVNTARKSPAPSNDSNIVSNQTLPVSGNTKQP